MKETWEDRLETGFWLFICVAGTLIIRARSLFVSLRHD